MDKLYEILKFEAEEINYLFEKASIEGEGTPQEISDRREIVVKKFLEKFFPFPFKVAKGNIIDSYGLKSQSIDCIILNPSHPYTISNEEKYSIIFADGVDVAIEVKPDMSSETEIIRSLQQIQSVKKLNKIRDGILLKSNHTTDYLNNAKKIPTFIFGTKASKDIRLLIEKIVNYYVNNSVPKNEQFDYIIINNRFIIYNSRKDSYFNLNNNLEGIFFVEYGKMTLLYFLLLLNKIPKSEPTMSSSVLEHYIDNNDVTFKQFEDLNFKLLGI
ncbi:MAG: hypothetical protein PHR68_02915 [Candidatus Gracilibacteria bacterium]|nr:hypothetical protein [Candidatus Gracilibacteria bacterium]